MMSNKSIAVIDGQVLSRKNFMDAIDQEVVSLYDTGNINRVMNVLNGLSAVEDISGHAKAKLLFKSSEWFKQNKPNDNFSDHVESTTTLRKITVDRYVLVWGYVEDLTIPKEIAEQPMRNLVPIATTLSQGYEISKEQWRKIGLCSNDRELDEVLRKVKGKQPRKNARIIKLGRDGSLWGWKNNERYFLGYLNVKEAQDNEIIAEFIEKIKTSAGVIDE
jgi:DNA-binding TFAR19-related protein (PDSD5 family)